MSNQINAEDWNIDKFSSVVFPNTTPVNIYREHLSSFNIQNIQTSTYGPSYLASDEGFGDQYEVIARKLQDPGNLEFFVVEGGWIEDIQAIRQYQMGHNTFGPSAFRAVDTNNQGGYSDEFGDEVSGYLEYSRSGIADGSIRTFVVDGYPNKSTPAIGPQVNSQQTPTTTFEVYNKITRQVDITQLDSVGIASRKEGAKQRNSQETISRKNRIDTWEKENGVEFYLGGTVNDNRGTDLSQSNFGPSILQAVDVGANGGYCDEFGTEITGLKQYSVGYGTDIRGSIIAQQAGFGVSAGIDFKVWTRDDSGQRTLQDSQLDQIGKERRKQEFLNRLKSNAAAETIGKINLDPFGLLAGQSLIIKDYRITKPKTLAGEILDFATSDLIGVELPVSIIPDDIYPQYGSGDKTSETLLDYTGAGQKAVLYNNLLKNKYGPDIEQTSRGGLAGLADKIGGPGDPPQKQGYLDYSGVDNDTRNKSLVDKVNDKTSGLVDSLFNQSGIGGTKDGPPTEGNKPSSQTTDPTKLDTYELGFDIIPKTESTEQGLDLYKFANVSNSSKRHSTLDTFHPVDRNLPTDNNELYWNSDRVDDLGKKGLLNYTQKLIRNKVDGARYIGEANSDLNQTDGNSLTSKHKTFSVGNLVKENKGAEDDGYCRSWSVRRAYTSYGDLIRNSGINLNSKGADSEAQKDGSVLKDPGVVKIGWESDGNFEESVLSGILANKRNHKVASQYMLSLENLAWKDSPHFDMLPNCEIGSNGGRIMWFPPYNIDFSDNTTASWDTTNFIGRGEPIYTYNSTERTGTLTFTLIMDHSSLMNKMEDNSVEEIDRFLWGCSDLSEFGDFISPREQRKITNEKDTINEEVVEIIPPSSTQPPFENLTVFFPNSEKDCQCGELPNGGQVVCETRSTNEDGCNGRYVNFDWERNAGLEAKLIELSEFLVGTDGDDSGKYYQINISGHASKKGKKEYNKKLSFDRALNVKDYLFQLMKDLEVDGVVKKEITEGEFVSHKSEVDLKNNYEINANRGGFFLTPLGEENRWKISGIGQDLATDTEDGESDESQGDDISNQDVQQNESRRVEINIVNKPGFTTTDVDTKVNELTPKEPNVEKINAIKEVAKIINKRVINECDIFEKVKEDDPFIYKSIKDKIRNFHPSFHSQTPEMFNSRLTFLQQCMRQGPQLNDTSQPQNMAFGRPPVCVLRIGDFYHTKVIIDSLNISYQNNSGIQWDLNPEGAGVQPMYATVDLNFKFIGGSSLGGPIKQLQNAVSFNYFANTSLYRPLEIFKSQQNDDGTFIKDVIGKTFYYGAYGSPSEENNPQTFANDQFDEGVETTNIIGVKDSNLTAEQLEAIEDGYDGGNNETVHAIDVNIQSLTTTDVNNQEAILTVTSKTGEIGFLDLKGLDRDLNEVINVKSVDILEGTTTIVESFPSNENSTKLDSTNPTFSSWTDLKCVSDSKCLILQRTSNGTFGDTFYIKSKSVRLKIKLFNTAKDEWCKPNGPDICNPKTKGGFNFEVISSRYQNLDAFQEDDSNDELLVSNKYNITVGFKACEGCIEIVEKVKTRETKSIPPVKSTRQLQRQLNNKVVPFSQEGFN